jgi:hypothetical protein
MPSVIQNPDVVVRRGQAYYDQRLRDRLEPEHKGKFLALNVETGEYEMDSSEMTVIERANARWSPNVTYIMRIGHPAAHRLGFRVKPS